MKTIEELDLICCSSVGINIKDQDVSTRRFNYIIQLCNSCEFPGYLIILKKIGKDRIPNFVSLVSPEYVFETENSNILSADDKVFIMNELNSGMWERIKQAADEQCIYECGEDCDSCCKARMTRKSYIPDSPPDYNKL